MDHAEHGCINNGGVKIHYASVGEGPLLVMIHGFPDFWYSWRFQMEGLSDAYHCVAMDQRGYNLSDKPKGQACYDITLLVSDVVAVIDHFGAEKAIVMGHDWGGLVAWTLAMLQPRRVGKLIICNLPHPRGISRELAHNPEQQANSAYARAFQQPGAHEAIKPEMLALFVAKEDAALRETYVEAFRNSDLEAMLHYYRQNYPREPYVETTQPLPPVQAPVLLFHGLKDAALHHHALNNTWEWVAADLTIVTLPNADHWVHHDEAAYVTNTIRDWLKRH
ncbi:MAG: alpha/beta hydrolase [Candidatus Hydrogenedentes bacterium]|nr:alpha/beta hydrolase [Candidatus Hydrogenedentota bacterium]